MDRLLSVGNNLLLRSISKVNMDYPHTPLYNCNFATVTSSRYKQLTSSSLPQSVQNNDGIETFSIWYKHLTAA